MISLDSRLFLISLYTEFGKSHFTNVFDMNDGFQEIMFSFNIFKIVRKLFS